VSRTTTAWRYTDKRLARAQSGADQWDFQLDRSGVAAFFGLRAAVTVTGRTQARLEAAACLLTGTLSLAPDVTLRWVTAATQSPSAFSDANGNAVVELWPGAPVEGVNYRVVVSPGAGADHWVLLAALGLYLRLLTDKRFT
jgi:hypothetical protein